VLSSCFPAHSFKIVEERSQFFKIGVQVKTFFNILSAIGTGCTKRPQLTASNLLLPSIQLPLRTFKRLKGILKQLSVIVNLFI